MQWKWDNTTKMTLKALIIGIFVGAMATLIVKYFKDTL